MMTFWKLLNLEVKRLAIPFVIMAIMVSAVQLYGAYAMAQSTINEAKEIMANEKIASIQQFEEQHGLASFADVVRKARSPWITLSIGLCIAFMLFYFFFIWYRDFLGKHPFMNRLLMVPASRHNLYFAKLIAPLIVLFVLLAIQLLLLPIESRYYSSLLPDELRVEYPLMYLLSAIPVLRILIPISTESLYFITAWALLRLLFSTRECCWNEAINCLDCLQLLGIQLQQCISLPSRWGSATSGSLMKKPAWLRG